MQDPSPLGEIVLGNPNSCSIEVNKENLLRLDICSPDRNSTPVCLETSNIQNLTTWVNTIKLGQNAQEEKDEKSNEDGDDNEIIQEQALRNPEHEGFLMKQGVTRKSWKRRWFVLNYPTLYYFSSAQVSELFK